MTNRASSSFSAMAACNAASVRRNEVSRSVRSQRYRDNVYGSCHAWTCQPEPEASSAAAMRLARSASNQAVASAAPEIAGDVDGPVLGRDQDAAAVDRQQPVCEVRAVQVVVEHPAGGGTAFRLGQLSGQRLRVDADDVVGDVPAGFADGQQVRGGQRVQRALGLQQRHVAHRRDHVRGQVRAGVQAHDRQQPRRFRGQRTA